MDTALQTLNAVAFVFLAFVAWRLWRRQSDAPSAWLTATFGTLAAVTVAGVFLPTDPRGTVGVAAVKVLVVLIVLYPYFLYRFMSAFGLPPRAMDRAAAAVTALVVLATLVTPRFPAQDEARPVWFELYALAIVLQWAFLGGVVGVRLWRAGAGQPTVTRRRMRVLAVGALLLILAILPGAFPSNGQPGVVKAATQLLPGLAAIFFITGFVPPAWLRMVWRRRETAALRDAEVELMGTMTAREVADALLPHVARVFGSPGAMLVGADGRPKATYGLTDMEAVELAVPVRNLSVQDPVVVAGHPALLALPLRDGWIVVPASAFTPFFGAEEINLLKGLGIFTDIALERAELFERERDARQAIEQANAELETLVYGVSHDLKSPIITLLGYLEYLRADHMDGLDEEGRYFIERMGASAQYMQALIQDLLELSRIGRVQTEPSEIDLAALLAEVSETARASHPGLVVATDALPTVRMNPVRARQLFTNLIENAARHAGRDDVCVRVSARPTGDQRVEISVADDGVGIPEAYRERVFGIFERLEARDAATSGTGMGLAICRKIVEQVRGEIRIVSSSTGADIRLTLPIASVAAADAPTVEARR
jgi:signal transduction histidine kinase